MKKQKTSRVILMTLLLSSLSFLLLSCTETVPNAQICADKGMFGATCAYTRGGPTTRLIYSEWQKQRVGWFCMDAKDLGKYQQFIMDSCAKSQTCVDEVNTFVNNLKK